MTAFFTCLLAALLAACNLGSSNPAASPQTEQYRQGLDEAGIAYRVNPFPDTIGSPIHVQRLSDSASVSVWQVDRVGAEITVYYEYNLLGHPTKQRTLLVNQNADHFLVYDGAGVLLSGYSATQDSQGVLHFTYVQPQTLLTIETAESEDSPIAFTLVAALGRQSVSFNDLSEMASAARLMAQVDASRVKEDSLSADQRVTLEKARTIRAWSPYLPDGDVDDDELDGLRSITNQPAVVGPGEGDYDEPLRFPWLTWLCRLAKAAKYLCEYLEPNKICEWIITLDAACTAAGIK